MKLAVSKITAMNLILFFGLLLITLVSHTIYSAMLGFVLLVIYKINYKIPFSKISIYQGLFLLILMHLYALWFQGYLVTKTLPLFSDAFYGNYIRILLCILIWIILNSLLVSSKNTVIKTLLRPLLKLHISAFYIQLIVYIFSGYYIDLLEPITGEASRYHGFDSTLSGVGAIRPTGMFSEPSTYFMCVLALQSLIFIHNGFEERKLFFLTLFSMYLSFSTSAVILATFLFAYYIYANKKNYKSITLLLIFTLLFILINFGKINNLYQAQIRKGESSSDMRLALIDLALERDLKESFLSYGPFAVKEDIYIASSATDIAGPREVASLNDSGLLVYLWLTLGYIGVVFYIFICIKEWKSGRHRLPLFLLLSATKISLFHPLFILYLAISLNNTNLYYSEKPVHKKLVNQKE